MTNASKARLFVGKFGHLTTFVRNLSVSNMRFVMVKFGFYPFILAYIFAALPLAAQAQDRPAILVPAASTEPVSDEPAPPPAPIEFTPGTGDGTPIPGFTPTPLVNRTLFACSALGEAGLRLLDQYGGDTPAKTRLDKGLLSKALDSYNQNNCTFGQYGPSVFAVVDFAKRSSEPRLWYIDLATAKGIDTPVLVTHGNGSDPDSDGYADRFSNIYNSRMSSLGAVRGAERYQGRNGLSLRLDGLEPGNNLMRSRDIVVHTAPEANRSYFSSQTRVRLNGAIGVSDGCFVVERHERERLLLVLENGGFLYAGIGTLDPSRKMPEIVTVWPPLAVPATTQPTQIGDILFVPGTGE
jgi:L,D-transpeptidase catalytic domain